MSTTASVTNRTMLRAQGSGDTLREVAGTASGPDPSISGANPGTAVVHGGGVPKGAKAHRRGTGENHRRDQIRLGPSPHWPADPAPTHGEAVAAVEGGPATGKVIVEIFSA